MWWNSCKNTADIGSFYIVKESGVSAGVRRIEAVCGAAAIAYTKRLLIQWMKLNLKLKIMMLLLVLKIKRSN